MIFSFSHLSYPCVLHYHPRKLALLAANALATVVASCNHNKLVSETPQPDALTQQPATMAANQSREALARALAQVLGQQTSLRKALKAEALLKFDGDFDVLYTAFASQQPDFEAAMRLAVPQTNPDQSVAGILSQLPFLNISVPVNINKWDAEAYAPLVLYIPAEYDERTYTKPLQAFDAAGGVHLINAKKAPEYPVIVVGPSERVRNTEDLAKLPTRKKLITDAQSKHYANLEGGQDTEFDHPATGDGGSGTPTPAYATYNPTYTGVGGPSCRKDKQIEYLRNMWMADVSVYEDWTLGDPEIKLQILTPTGSSGTLSATVIDTRYEMGRRTIRDTYNCNTTLHYWDKSRLGDVLAYIWIEEDYGDVAEVKTTLGYTSQNGGPNGSVEITHKIANHDDEISKSLMFFDYCPSEGYYSVNGGNAEFRWAIENRP